MVASQGRVHVVKEGDTVWDIAMKAGACPDELLAARGGNHSLDPTGF